MSVIAWTIWSMSDDFSPSDRTTSAVFSELSRTFCIASWTSAARCTPSSESFSVSALWRWASRACSEVSRIDPSISMTTSLARVISSTWWLAPSLIELIAWATSPIAWPASSEVWAISAAAWRRSSAAYSMREMVWRKASTIFAKPSCS